MICIFSLLIIGSLLLLVLYNMHYNREKTDESTSADDDHEILKQDILNYLQSVIDKNENGSSFRTSEYEIDENVVWGDIYVIDKVEDIKYIKELLEHFKPIYGVRYYEPMPAMYILVASIELGYAGGGDYYFKYNRKTSLGFTLPTEYNDKLWDFLYSLEKIED